MCKTFWMFLKQFGRQQKSVGRPTNLCDVKKVVGRVRSSTRAQALECASTRALEYTNTRALERSSARVLQRSVSAVYFEPPLNVVQSSPNHVPIFPQSSPTKKESQVTSASGYKLLTQIKNSVGCWASFLTKILVLHFQS